MNILFFLFLLCGGSSAVAVSCEGNLVASLFWEATWPGLAAAALIGRIGELGPIGLMVAPPVQAAWLAVSMSAEEGKWLITGLGVTALVIGILVGLKRLRETPAPQKTTIANMPIEVRAVVAYVEEPTFREFEQYVHKKNHEFATQLQHLELGAEERRLEAAEHYTALLKEVHALGDKLDAKRSANVADLYQQLKQAELRAASVAKEAEVHTQQLAAVDQKLTNILQRLPRNRE